MINVIVNIVKWCVNINAFFYFYSFFVPFVRFALRGLQEFWDRSKAQVRLKNTEPTSILQSTGIKQTVK